MQKCHACQSVIRQPKAGAMHMHKLKSKTDYLSPQLRKWSLIYMHTCVCKHMCLCVDICVCVQYSTMTTYSVILRCVPYHCLYNKRIVWVFFPFQERYVNIGPQINFFTDFCTNLQKMLKVGEGKPDCMGVISS